MRFQRVGHRFSGVATPDVTTWYESVVTVPRFVTRRMWRPPADVWETDSQYIVRMDLPGITEEDIQVMLFDDALVIEGERRPSRLDGRAVCHAAEIRRGPFRFALQLPPCVDAEGATATLEQGMLDVRLPKRTEGERS